MARSTAVGQIDIDPPLPGRDRRRLRGGGWTSCREGCCLSLVDDTDAAEQLREVIGWLPTVHRLTGMVVCQREDGELLGIRVTNRRVYTKALQPGRDAPPRRPRREQATVIRLDERR